MNKREHLITETFASPTGEQFARTAAAHVRRRRAARLAFLVGSTACLGALLFSSLRRPESVSGPPPPLTQASAPVLEIISDDELLAQLKNQPVLILKEGSAIVRVVFLDSPAQQKL